MSKIIKNKQETGEAIQAKNQHCLRIIKLRKSIWTLSDCYEKYQRLN